MRPSFTGALSAFALLFGCGGEARPPRVEIVAPPPPAASLAPVASSAPVDHGCFAPLAAKKPVDQAKLDALDAKPGPDAEKRYERGRIYFETQHYAEAGPEFRAVAFQYPDSSVGMYGAELYLECLNFIGTSAPGRPCFDDLARDVPELIEIYCRERRSARESECQLFEAIRLDLERRRDEKLVAVADKSGDPSDYRAAADGFSRTLHDRCTPAPEGSRCDEIAFNLAMTYLAAGDAASAKTVLAVMRDPRNHLERSALVATLACRLDPGSSPRCRALTPPP